MFADSTTLPFFSEIRQWLLVGGIFWSVFKAYTYIKTIKDTDLARIQDGLASTHTELRTQTNSIVDAVVTNTNEIKELRVDIRTLTTAFMAPPRARAAARRKKK